MHFFNQLRHKRNTICAGVLLCLPFGGAFAADHPNFSGAWTKSESHSNIGLFTGPGQATDTITQTDTAITVARNRDGQNELINIPLDGSTGHVGEKTMIQAHWEENSIVIDFSSNFGNIEERWSLIRGGTTFLIYAKGPQSARVSIVMVKQ